MTSFAQATPVRRTLLSLSTAAAFAAMSLSASAAVRTYTGADTTVWSSGSSWGSGLPIDGADDVAYRNTATGTNVFDLASGFDILRLGVASRDIDNNGASINVTTTLNLNTRTLNATTLEVGRNTTGSASNWTGNLTLTNGTLNVDTGRFWVGHRTGSTGGAAATGTVTGTNSSIVNATNLTSFIVALTDHQGGAGVGTVDFANVLGGTFSVIGSETATDRVIIGGRMSGSSGGNGTNGIVALGNNWTSTTFGTSTAARTNMLVGYRNGNGSAAGSFTQSGGTFDAFLNNLFVGERASGSDTPTVTGTINLSGATSDIDVNTMRIGTNNTNHTGTVTVGIGDVLINTAAIIGGGTKGTLNLNRTDFTVGSGAAITLGTTGKVRVEIGSVSAGIDILNSAAGGLVINNSATITNDRGVLITFAENPTGLDWVATAGEATDIFYGFKWAGDKVATLNPHISGGRFNWDDSALTGQFEDKVSLFYDSSTDATYVGFYVVPEPGSLALLAVGALLMLPRRKR